MAQVPELQRFRAKYPEYGDMDDAALADRLAAKYPEAYSDLPGKVRSETPEPPRQDHNFGGVAISAPPAAGSRQEVMGIASPADRRAARTAINIAKPIPAMGYAQVKQGLGGLARIVGAEEWGKAQTDEAEAVIRQIETEHPLERDSWAEAARSAGASIVAQAPSLALGAVGAPMAGLALLGAQAGGAEIDLQLDKGSGKHQAALAGGTVGLAEALTEKIPFDNLFARGIPVGKRLLKQYVSELLGENIATSVESAVHKITVEPDMTWDDYVRALKNTTKQTIVQTSVMGGAASAIHGLAGGETADSSPQAPRRPVGPDTDLLNQLPDDPEYTARQERVQSRLATAIQPAQQAQASDNVGSFLDPMMRRAMENRRGASFAPDPLVTNTVNAVPVGAPYERVEAEVLPPAAEPSFTPTALIPQFARDVESEDMGTYDLPPPSVIAESEEADMTAIDRAAHEAATSPLNSLPEPTEGQKKAGNYKKGHTSIYGLGISIENPVGSVRGGVDKDGTPWRTELKDSYGYFKRTTGKDKDHIDVFIPAGFTPDVLDDQVFVIDQIDPETGRFDEHKIVFGARTADEARTIYLRNYDASGFRRIGAVTGTTVPDFKKWLGSKRKTTQPFGEIQRGQEFSQTARPAGMGRAETAPVTDTSAEAVSPVRGVDGQSGDGMPVVQSGDVAAEQAIPGTDSGNTATGVVEGGDTGGQEEGRRQEVLNNEGATPLPETVSAPRPPASFDEMVQEAARWKGAATKVSASLGDDKKAQVRHNKLTTKGDLDAYLMRKFGVDEVTARDVSNALTAQNIPADKTADIQDFASEPWAVPAQETSGPSTRPADVNKEDAPPVAFQTAAPQEGEQGFDGQIVGARHTPASAELEGYLRETGANVPPGSLEEVEVDGQDAQALQAVASALGRELVFVRRTPVGRSAYVPAFYGALLRDNPSRVYLNLENNKQLFYLLGNELTANKENAGDGAILSQEAQNGQRAENPAMAGAVQGSQGISGVADGAADTQAEGRATDARDGALRDDDLLRIALQTIRDVESDNIIIDGNRARASWSTRDSLVPWLDIPGWTPRQAALALEKYLANPNDRTIGKTQRLVVEKALAYERELADRYAAEIETYTDELASADVSFDFGFNATEKTDNSVQTDPAPRFERTAAGDQGKLFATPPSFGTKKQGGVAGLEDMALFTEPKERAAEQAQTTLQSILSSERGSIELPNREEAAAMVKGMTDSLNRLFGSATGVYGATKLMAADAAETLFGKPIFTAERRPTLKPVVENAINRQQDFHETLANFYEWNEDEGTVTTLIDLRKEHKKLPRADKKAVAKLVFEGDILKGEFETVESARAALGGDVAVSRTAFDFYRRFRAYINTLYRKVRQEQVANALVPYESSPELHDTLRAMLEYDGELNADMVEPAVWDAFMDVKGMQLIAPEYQNKPWFDDLVNLLGYKFREKSQKHAWNKQAPWKEVKGTPEKWADKISTDTLESPARMKELVAALKHIQENKLIEKRVRRAKEQVMETRKGLKAMRDDFGALPGWFPRLRNDGRFYVAVTMPAAEAGAKPVLVYYELVGSPEAAKALEKKIAADPSRYVPKEYQEEGAEFTTSTGESSKLDESIYAAAAGDLAIQAVIDRGLSRMKDKEGLNDSEYDELQSSLYRSTLDVILARGAGRHQIKRADHLIGGYRTDDPFQILDDYIRGTVGSITKARYSMRQAIALRELSGSDQAWAFGYVRDTLMNTSQAQRVAATMAGIATFNYLGFRFTSALLNATQNWTYGYPELSIHSRRAASVMAKAQKDILTGRKLGAEEQAALEQGIRKGMSMETITSEMAGHGEGMQNRFGQGVTALNNVAMWLFQMVERYVNREAGFLAAYRVFRTPDFAPTRQDPYDSVAVEKALDFVAKVHGVPGKANMPAWARTNPVGRGVFTLSSFTMDRFNWLFNRLTSGEKQQVMAAARAVGVMVLLGGVGSLPFLDEINRLLRGLFGVDFKLEARKWVEEKARDYGAPEDAIADYIFHGAPAGAGINVSNAMRVQVPIASALLQGEGALEAVSGPLGGVVLKVAKAGEMAAKGEGDKVLESLAPEAVATALRAKRLSEEGMTTSGGKLILDRDPKTGEIGPVKLDPSERAVKSLGFNPLEASKRMEKADTRIALKQFWTERKDRALARVNALLLTGKQEDRQTANNLVLKFNARLAESQARGLVPPITRVKPYKLDKRAIQWDSAQEEE